MNQPGQHVGRSETLDDCLPEPRGDLILRDQTREAGCCEGSSNHGQDQHAYYSNGIKSTRGRWLIRWFIMDRVLGRGRVMETTQHVTHRLCSIDCTVLVLSPLLPTRRTPSALLRHVMSIPPGTALPDTSELAQSRPTCPASSIPYTSTSQHNSTRPTPRSDIPRQDTSCPTTLSSSCHVTSRPTCRVRSCPFRLVSTKQATSRLTFQAGSEPHQSESHPTDLTNVAEVETDRRSPEKVTTRAGRAAQSSSRAALLA